MSIFSAIGNALSSVTSGSSWGSIIGAGLQVGGSLMQNSASNKQADAAYTGQQQTAQSQLIQSEAELRAAAAQQQEGTFKQIEYNRQASEATENASRALTNAAVKAALLRRAGKETAENALAGYAASGVVSGAGSAAYVPAYIVGRAEEDAYSAFQEGKDSAAQYTKQADAFINAGTQAKSASDVAAAGITEQANAMQTLAGMTQQAAGQAKDAAKTSSTANLLASAASIASKWFS